MKNQLKASIWIMGILGGVLMIGSLIASFGAWNNYYESMLFIAPVIALAVDIIFCLTCFPVSIKKIGFFICHIGIVLIILCGFVSWAFTKDTSFAIPISPNAFYGEVMQNDGTELKFGYDISIASFEVEKYDAEYCLYNNNRDFSDENILMETVTVNRKDVYDLGKYGEVSADELRTADGYVSFYELENGYSLVKYDEADKSYRAVMQIYDGEFHSATLEVNKPYTYKGWKFYLMGYDENNMRYVNLYVKKDPANIPMAIGIWMTVVGTFAECISCMNRRSTDIQKSGKER